MITITPANQAALGLSEPRYQPRGAQHRVRHRQARSPAERQQPRLAALHLLRQLHHRQRRRRHRCSVQRAPTSPTGSTRRRCSSSPPSAANLLNELRVQYATRAQGRVPAGLAGTGPAINVTNVANFGGPIASLTDAGFGFTQDVGQINNSLTYLWRRPRVQGRLRHPARGRHPHQHAVPALHLRHHGRLPGRAQRRRALRLQHLPAVLRRARPGLLVEPLRLLRAGRLAAVATRSRCSTACATTSTTCRRPTPPRRTRPRATSWSTRTTWRRGSAWSGALGERPPHGHARQHRHDVRPGAAGQLRAGAHQRRHQHPRRGHLPADARPARRPSPACCRPVPAPRRTR